MNQFRKIIFWLHLSSGVIAGIFIFLMCVTGAVLSFESNILEFAEREMRFVSVPAENNKRLSVSEIINRVQTAKPNAKPSNMTLRNEKSAAAVVVLGREGQVFINPYTGEITGDGAKGWRGFFGVTEDLHRRLALSGNAGIIGKAVNDAGNCLFLFLAVSGIYIWFPRRLSWRHFKPVLWFRRGLKGKARDFNWHNTIGFWSSLILVILTATAIVMSYQWANNLLYVLTGNQPPQQQQAANRQGEQAFVLPENFDEIWTKAENHTPWKTIAARLPIANGSVVFTIDEGIYLNIFGRSTLTIDAKTSEISKWESYGEQNSGRRLRNWVRFTHTGESVGIVGQIIGFLACIGGAFLVWTGLSLVWRRFRGRLSKQPDIAAPDNF
ncbi:MAG: PepSY-associated TM helix domain-containing protein [Pyrinomonadaceae bacterium]